jgi:hypothetical protein
MWAISGTRGSSVTENFVSVNKKMRAHFNCSEYVTWVGIGKQRADGEQDFRDGQGRAPLILENVEADATVAVDVGVIDLGCEADFGRLEGLE